jgi:hypothetical protein
MVRIEVLDYRQRRASLLEQVEHQPDGLLDLLVRIEHDSTGRIEDQPGRWTEP